MNITILCIGKVKDEFNRCQIEDICRQINKGKHKIEIIEYPDIKIPERLKESGKENLIEKECEKMMNRITNRDYVIGLCIEGKELSSKKHEEYIRKAIEDGYESVIYLIGGSLGLPEKLKKRANLKLSFSKMTFPHQLMRMVLCEEVSHILHTM
ncbi:MAG: 23S rRNA (pseudouridine(1915)-N(3))-methyltransferase RlmH [Lachnospiraceae bacterium]